MAEAAEQLLAGTGWLPALLRTARPALFPEAERLAAPDSAAIVEADAEPATEGAPDGSDVPAADDGSGSDGEAFHIAAE